MVQFKRGASMCKQGIFRGTYRKRRGCGARGTRQHGRQGSKVAGVRPHDEVVVQNVDEPSSECRPGHSRPATMPKRKGKKGAGWHTANPCAFHVFCLTYGDPGGDGARMNVRSNERSVPLVPVALAVWAGWRGQPDPTVECPAVRHVRSTKSPCTKMNSMGVGACVNCHASTRQLSTRCWVGGSVPRNCWIEDGP